MAIRDDLPTFGNTSYADSVSNAANYGAVWTPEEIDKVFEDAAVSGVARRVFAAPPLKAADVKADGGLHALLFQKQQEVKVTTRLLKLFVADPDPKVPLESRLLHKTEEFMTDSADQDLFYDLDIKGILAKHNELRKTIVDKKASEGRDKEVFLEPIKASGLRIQVVVLASF